MILQTDGKLGIGTVATERLSVAGKIHSTTGGFRFPDGTTQTTAATTDDGNWTGAGTGTMFTTNFSDNVGIGTDLVSSKLTVAGTIETSTGIKFGDGTTQTTAAITDDNDWQGAGTGAMLTANFNDKVGIRSEFAPVFDLQVAHASASNDAQQFPCIIAINTDPTIGSAASGTFNFSKVLATAGNGTVNGGFLASFGDGSGGIGNALAVFTGTDHPIVFNASLILTGPTPDMILQTDGKLGIGTFATERLSVAGKIHSTTGGFKFPDGSVMTSASTEIGGDAQFNDLNITGLFKAGGGISIAGGGVTGPNEEIFADNDLFIQSNPAQPHHTIINNGHLGRVGIGVGPGPTELLAKLDVKNTDINVIGFRLTAPKREPILVPGPSVLSKLAFQVRLTNVSQVSPFNAFSISDTGVVTIGGNQLTIPGPRLQVFQSMGTFLNDDISIQLKPGQLNSDITWSSNTFQIPGKDRRRLRFFFDDPDDNSNDKEVMTLRPNGNVGIGTAFPNSRLEVHSGGLLPSQGQIHIVGSGLTQPTSDTYISFLEEATFDCKFSVGILGVDKGFAISSGLTIKEIPEFFISESTGNIGINTTIPGKKLVVNGDVQLLSDDIGFDGFQILFDDDGTKQPFRRGITFDPNGKGNFNFFIHQFQSPAAFNFIDGFDDEILMTIGKDGNVGIGTPTKAGFKLSVCGGIIAEDVTIDIIGCDFVFEDNYKLMYLNELEQYIKMNNHLPGIPSAKQVETDGVSVSEMISKLLQKIEELTLYTIQQDKAIKELKIQIDEKSINTNVAESIDSK